MLGREEREELNLIMKITLIHQQFHKPYIECTQS